MYIYKPTISAVMALAVSTSATPLNYNGTLESRAPAAANTFNLHVWNNCKFVKQVALYSVTSDFQMQQRSPPTNIQPLKSITIAAPFKASGMRLSGHAEWGTDGQWRPQALFEFGYSTYAGQEGTAYDLSLMSGSDPALGLGAYVIPNARGSASCPDKTCFPWYCPPNQGWLDPNQSGVGDVMPDTVCYKGKTDFKIVYCP